MDLVSYPTLAPSICIICEGVPPETPFVDTLRTFDPNGYTHLNGRKYLCLNCCNDAAQAFGLLEDAVAPVQAQSDELADKVAELTADVESYQAIQAAVEQLAARPTIQVEDTVALAVDAATTRRKSRAQSAAEAQAAIAADLVQQEAGAAAQVAAEQEAEAVRAQAAADAAAASSITSIINVDPDPGTPVVDPPVEDVPVVDDGTNADDPARTEETVENAPEGDPAPAVVEDASAASDTEAPASA